MRLTEAQSRELLLTHGVYLTEACDRCGALIHYANRFTRKDDPGVWCSRECRDGAAAAEIYRATRKAGRPLKYQTDHERQAAKRQQDAIAQRKSRCVRKNPLVTDSFHGSTEAENRPLAISLPGKRA
jgi:hypothetical protein